MISGNKNIIHKQPFFILSSLEQQARPDKLNRSVFMIWPSLFILFIFSLNCNAQSLKRQCVASAGSLISANGAAVQQTIGQPYGASTYYSDETRFNPGFQQPVFRIETIKSTINAAIFPNPASNKITIETNVQLENVTLQIIDLNGKLVLNEKINEFKSYTIYCGNWANGAYLIILSDSKNDLYSSKLIISR